MDMKTRRDAVKELAIDIEGEVLNIKYRPDRVTGASLRALAEAEEQVKQDQATASDTTTQRGSQLDGYIALVDATADTIVKQVAEWDLTNEDEPVPISREGMEAAGVDFALMTIVVGAIREDQSPNRMTPTDSGSFS